MNNSGTKLSRILLVEDDELIRAALCILIESIEGVELVGRAANGAEALAMVLNIKPDLILMDLLLPVMDGIEATVKIKNALPKTAVIALTASEDASLITRAIECGMDGILLKRTSVHELKQAIRMVTAGERYLSPQVSSVIADAYLEVLKNKNVPTALLTPREKQVVGQVAKGKRYKQIADELCISERTVEKHCEQARKKLKAGTTSEMVALWLTVQQEFPD